MTPSNDPTPAPGVPQDLDDPAVAGATMPAARPLEVGGRAGPEPTRFGDWEKNGRCIDF